MGVDEKTKEGLNFIMVAPLQQTGARRAFQWTPADMGCGGRAQAFKADFTSGSETGSGGVPFWAGGG